MWLLLVAAASFGGRKVRTERSKEAVEVNDKAALGAEVQAVQVLDAELAAELGAEAVTKCRLSDMRPLSGPGPCSCGDQKANDCPAEYFCWEDRTCNVMSRVSTDRADCRAADALDLVLKDSPRTDDGTRFWDLRLAIPGETYDKNIYAGVRDLLISSGQCEAFLSSAPGSSNMRYALSCDADFSAKLKLIPPRSGLLGVAMSTLVSGEKDVHGTAKVRYAGVATQVVDQASGKLKWDYQHERDEVNVDLGGSSTYMNAVLSIVSAALNRLGGLNAVVFKQVAEILQRVIPPEDYDEYMRSARDQYEDLQEQAQAWGEQDISDESAVGITANVELRTPRLGEPLDLKIRFSQSVLYPGEELARTLANVQGTPPAERLGVRAVEGLATALHGRVVMAADRAFSPKGPKQGQEAKLRIATDAPTQVKQCFTPTHLEANGGALMCPHKTQRIVAIERCESADPFGAYRSAKDEVAAAASRLSGSTSDAIQQRLQYILKRLPEPPATAAGAADEEPAAVKRYREQIVREIVGADCLGLNACFVPRSSIKKWKKLDKKAKLTSPTPTMSFTCASSGFVFGSDTMARRLGSNTKSKTVGTSLYFDPEIPSWSLFRDESATAPATRGATYQIIVTSPGLHSIHLQGRLQEAEVDEPDLHLAATLTKVGREAGAHDPAEAVRQGWSRSSPFSAVPTPSVEGATAIRDAQAGFLYHDFFPGGTDLEVGVYQLQLEFDRQDLQFHKRAFQIDAVHVTPPDPRPTQVQVPAVLLPHGKDARGWVDVVLGSTRHSLIMEYVQAVSNLMLEKFSARKRKPFEVAAPPMIPGDWSVNGTGKPVFAATGEVVAQTQESGVPRHFAQLAPGMRRPREVAPSPLELRTLLPYAEVSATTQVDVVDVPLLNGVVKPHVVSGMSFVLQAKLSLNAAVQGLLNPSGSKDFGYPFFAGSMTAERDGARSVLMNCGTVQVFADPGGTRSAAPSEEWPVEHLSEAVEEWNARVDPGKPRVGDTVVVRSPFVTDSEDAVPLTEGMKGTVEAVEDGDVSLSFPELEEQEWVHAASFGNLEFRLPGKKCLRLSTAGPYAHATTRVCGERADLLSAAIKEQQARSAAADPSDPLTGTHRTGTEMYGLPEDSPVKPLFETLDQ